MIPRCGKAVGELWKSFALVLSSQSFNRFKCFPQVIHFFSTGKPMFSTATNRNLSTFPQVLLLQLYILTNPFSFYGEF